MFVVVVAAGAVVNGVGAPFSTAAYLKDDTQTHRLQIRSLLWTMIRLESNLKSLINGDLWSKAAAEEMAVSIDFSGLRGLWM